MDLASRYYYILVPVLIGMFAIIGFMLKRHNKEKASRISLIVAVIVAVSFLADAIYLALRE